MNVGGAGGNERVVQWREGLFEIIFEWFLQQHSSAELLQMVLTPPEQNVLESFLEARVHGK
jgi:hypothetical protein